MGFIPFYVVIHGCLQSKFDNCNLVADVPRHVTLRGLPRSNMLSYYVMIMYYNVYVYMYKCMYNRVTAIYIDLSKIKLLILVFVFVIIQILVIANAPIRNIFF